MNYNNMGVYNFSVIQGVTHVEIFSNWMIHGSPIDLQEIDEIRVDFKRDSKNTYVDLSLSMENEGLKVIDNKLEFHFGDNTSQLDEGVYLYDILFVHNGSRNNYVRGTMTVYPTITK